MTCSLKKNLGQKGRNDFGAREECLKIKIRLHLLTVWKLQKFTISLFAHCASSIHTFGTLGKALSQSAAKYLWIFHVVPQSNDFSMYIAAGLDDLNVIIKWVTWNSASKSSWIVTWLTLFSDCHQVRYCSARGFSGGNLELIIIEKKYALKVVYTDFSVPSVNYVFDSMWDLWIVTFSFGRWIAPKARVSLLRWFTSVWINVWQNAISLFVFFSTCWIGCKVPFSSRGLPPDQ